MIKKDDGEKFSIAKAIREARKRLGMNQKQFSEASGIPQTTISRIESGQIIAPRLNVLKKLSSALKMPLDQLTGLESKSSPEKILSVDADAKSLLDTYVELPPEKQKMLLELACYLSGNLIFYGKKLKKPPNQKGKGLGLFPEDTDSSSS